MADHKKEYKAKAILFDFDGTLSNGRFYSTLKYTHPDVYKSIQDKVFSKNNWGNLSLWMRGEIDYRQFNEIASTLVGLPAKELDVALIESLDNFTLNKDLHNFAIEQRSNGIQTAIFTDNMDVFEKHLVTKHGLDKKFDYIFSSASYGKLKGDNDGEFLEFTSKTFAVPINQILFIDNSKEAERLMKKKGGLFYLWENYNNQYPQFIEWYNNL